MFFPSVRSSSSSYRNNYGWKDSRPRPDQTNYNSSDKCDSNRLVSNSKPVKGGVGGPGAQPLTLHKKKHRTRQRSRSNSSSDSQQSGSNSRSSSSSSSRSSSSGSGSSPQRLDCFEFISIHCRGHWSNPGFTARLAPPSGGVAIISRSTP